MLGRRMSAAKFAILNVCVPPKRRLYARLGAREIEGVTPVIELVPQYHVIVGSA